MKINTAAGDGSPWVAANGLELYFASWRLGGFGGGDIFVTRRAMVNDPWGEPVNLGPTVNSGYDEDTASLSPDGLLLILSAGNRPGGYGGSDVWMTRRATLSDPWQAAVNLGPVINTATDDGLPRISPDGRILYFWSARSGGWENYQAPILPIVDFNADKRVDLVDLVMLIDDWGTNQTLCDIGPMPWGDGKVDIEDLKVFMAEWEKQNPPVKP